MGCTNSNNVARPVHQSSLVINLNHLPFRHSDPKSEIRKVLMTKTKTRFIPKEPEWDTKLDNELECMVCLEIVKTSQVTECCMNIICQDCTKKLNNQCPLRCDKLKKQFGTRIGLTDRINKVKLLCDLCLSDVHPWELTKHKEQCGIKELGEEVKVLRLHNQTLIGKTSETGWKCHARETPYEDHKDFKSDEFYKCKNCELKFCRFCVAKAIFQGDNLEINGKGLDSPGSIIFKCEKTEIIVPPKPQVKKPVEPKAPVNLKKRPIYSRKIPRIFGDLKVKKPLRKKKISAEPKDFQF